MAQNEKKKKSVRIDVAKPLLQWAMHRSNKRVDDLSQKKPLKNLGEWMEGTKKPTLTQLEAFARATYTPFGCLLLSEPPVRRPSTIPHFRTMSDDSPMTRSIHLEDTIKIVKRRQEWVRDYLIEMGVGPLEFVGSVDIDDDPVDASVRIKDVLGLTPDWTARYSKVEKVKDYLYKQIEDKGIFISKNSIVQYNTRRALDPNEFRGFVLVDDYAPFVFINSADIEGAQMFTLAHELAHVWLGKSASFDLRGLAANPRNKIEMTCNKIAAEFLVPTDVIHKNWDRFSNNDKSPYVAASAHFMVSEIVAARRALDTGLISQADFDAFYHEYRHREQTRKQKQKEEKGGPTFITLAPLRISKRFVRMVVTAVKENKILHTDAHRLTGLNPATLAKVSDRIERD